MAHASAEKLKHTWPAEKESEQWASTPVPHLPKGKGTESSAQITRLYLGLELAYSYFFV